MGSSEGYPLKPGNIIKFGRVQYLVVEMKTLKDFVSIREGADLKNVSGFKGVYEVKDKEQKQIKEGAEEEDKLVDL